jgi:hypothetical protein
MQNSTGQAEASIPTETAVAINSLNLNSTFTVRRRAAKRSERWYQNTAAPLPIPTRKKPRLEEPLPTMADEAARKTASLESSEGLPLPTADNCNDDVNTDLATVTQPNSTGCWTPEEDAELTSAVANTHKKKHGKEHKIDWVSVATLVPRRTKKQCWSRWQSSLDPSIGIVCRRKGKWEEDEDTKLTSAVQRHGGKNWGAIAALVMGRAEKQCRNRWYLDPSLERANGRKGKWEEDEDKTLKDAVREHGCKSWDIIASLVSGRTKIQCRKRWHGVLNPSIDRANGCLFYGR